jgi:methionine aminopeptidase
MKIDVVFIFALCFAVDITLYRNGYHGDLNETFFVGDVDEGARKLVQTTYECLMQAIDAGQSQGWTPLGAFGH